MNYYDARQTKDKRGWHYTKMNDGVIWPVGYCADHEPHETADEAFACFDRFLLDEIREEAYGDWTSCEWVSEDGHGCCGKPTKQGLSTRPPLGHGHALCDEHRTEEIVRDIAGWHGKHIQITASY